MNSLVLGLDISTTAAKALLIDARGAVVGSASTPVRLLSPRPLWFEENPQDWWRSACESIRQALGQAGASGGDVLAIGLTGQMHGLVLLDAEGQVLRPAILWNDQRTAAQCDEIRAIVGAQRLIQITGNDALTGFTAPKILWVRENEPEVYARVAHILLPKDYVRYRLTGSYAVDKADGSGTILFDLEKRTWSAEMLELLHIPLEWLPETYEGTAITGQITPEAAQATGLLAGTPVVAGGGDQSAQAVGVGAVAPGVAALTLGTSGVVFTTTPAAVIEPHARLHAFCHAVPGRWHVMGVMLSAAGSLQWYHDALAPSVPIPELVQEAGSAPPGSEGLLFLPYLAGERTPHPDPLARGAWFGLNVRHGRAHLTRALLEGVAFGLKDNFDLMRSLLPGEIREVRVSGGGAQSDLWLQIIADVLNAELTPAKVTEGAAYGAALLAGVAAGLWPSVEDASRSVFVAGKPVVPNPAAAERYEPYYRLYRELYPATRDIAHALSRESD